MKEPGQKQPDFLQKQPVLFVIIITDAKGSFLDLNQLYHKIQNSGTKNCKNYNKTVKNRQRIRAQKPVRGFI